jgi:Na+/melibiose symporter-like transporter
MTDSNLQLKKRSIRTKRLAFTIPRIASSLLLGTVGFALFFLYTLAYDVSEALVGIGIGVGYVSIAAGQFILGWISDGKYTRWGRRKPYIFILAPINALSFVFVLLPYLILKNPSEITLFIWLITFDGIFQFSYAYTTVYQACMPEQFSVEDRPRVSQTQNIYNIIGQAIMLLFTFLVLTNIRGQIEANPSVIPPEFLITVIIFAAFLIIFYYLGTYVMPTEPYRKIDSNYIEHLITIFKHKNYLSVTLMQGIASFAWIIMTTVMLNYIQIVLRFGTLEYLLAAFCLLIGVF